MKKQCILMLALMGFCFVGFAQEDIDQLATQKAIDAITPVNPDDIKKVRRGVQENKKAARTPLVDIEPNLSTEILDIEKHESIKIFTRYGLQTSLTFLDVAGEPWPVLKAIPGNSEFTLDPDSSVIKDGEKTTVVNNHTFSITPTTEYGQTNLAVRLHGVNHPIVFSLVDSMTEKVDFSRIFKINRIYPFSEKKYRNTPQHVIASNSEQSNLEKFVTDVPDGAVSLKTNTSEIRAWRLGEKFYIKTIYDIADEFDAVAYGANEVRVYRKKFMPTSLYFLKNGDPLEVRFEEDELVDINTMGQGTYE